MFGQFLNEARTRYQSSLKEPAVKDFSNYDLIKFIIPDENCLEFSYKPKFKVEFSPKSLVDEISQLNSESEKFLQQINTLIFNVKNENQVKVLISLRNSVTNFRIRYPSHCQNLPVKDACSLKSDKDKGKILIANRDIAIGEIICSDDSYAFALTDNYAFACAGCLTITPFLIPCDYCSEVGFCSVSCGHNSRKRHSYECGYIKAIQLQSCAGWNESSALKELNIKSPKILHLAFNTVSGTNSTDLKALIDRDPKNCQFLSGQRPPVEYEGFNNLNSLNRLLTNNEKMTLAKRWQYAVASIQLAYILKLKGYLTLDNGESMEFHHLCSFLMFCIQVVSTNGHSRSIPVVPFDEKTISLHSIRHIEFTSNLFTKFSLVNHSCTPNATRVSLGKGKEILVAMQSIKNGDEILDNYGFDYFSGDKVTRQKDLLDQYYFLCQCRACNENWKFDILSMLTTSSEKKVDQIHKEFTDYFYQDSYNINSEMLDKFIEKHWKLLMKMKRKLEKIRTISCKPAVQFPFNQCLLTLLDLKYSPMLIV